MSKILKSLIIIICLLVSSVAFAANGDITAASIVNSDLGNGWVLKLDVESSGGSAIAIGGTYNLGLGTNNDPTNAKITLTVSTAGFDHAGSTTNYTRTIYGQVRMRLPVWGQAEGTLTSTGTNPADGDTVTINTTVYRFKSTMAQALDVQIGTDAATTLSNLKKAINLTGTGGTEYYTGTSGHATCYADELTATTLKVYANNLTGTGTLYPSEDSGDQLSWGAATLGDGTSYTEKGAETLADSVLSLYIILSDHIYSGDTISAISVTAGVYSDGTTSTGTYSGAVTNNSTETPYKPVTNWTRQPRDLVGSTVDLSMIGGSGHMLSMEPLAAVVFSCTDATHTATATVAGNAMTRTTDGYAQEFYHYATTLNISTLGEGVITCNYKAYPHLGAAGTVFDTNDNSALAETAWLPHPIKFYKDADSNYGQSYAYVAPGNAQCTAEGVPNTCCSGSGTGTCTGDDTTAAASNVAATAKASPAATIEKAISLVNAYNAANYSRTNTSNSIIYLEEGKYLGTGTSIVTTESTTPTCYATITKDPSAAKANVIIASNSNSSYLSVASLYLRLKDVTLLQDVNSYILTAASSGIWDVDGVAMTGNTTYNTPSILGTGLLLFQRRSTITDANMHPGFSQINIGNTLSNTKDFGSPHVIIGNHKDDGPALNGVYTESSSEAGKSDGAVIYNNVFKGLFGSSNLCKYDYTLGLLMVQNLFEMETDTNDSGIASLGVADGKTLNNIIVVNNSFAGARILVGYNTLRAQSPHNQWLIAGNMCNYLANKQDDFQDSTSTGYRKFRTGGWIISYGVNCYGNINSKRTAAFLQRFSGLYSTLDGAVDVDNGYLLNGSDPYDNGTGTGGGNYHLKSNSPGANVMVNKSLWPYDLDGNRRRGEAEDAGCYTRGLGKVF